MRTETVHVIVGPTASGKSDYAIRLAHEIGGEIVSADSRQVYRGMDIGTGKVPRDASRNSEFRISNFEKKAGSKKPEVGSRKPYYSGGIRHNLLDVASPRRTYTVTHFLRDAEAAIADIGKRGKVPIVCGGTNFWIEALVLDSSFPEVRPDPELRKALGRLTAPELFAMLGERDPERAETIDRHNKVRLVRALEIVATLGKVPKSDNDQQITDNGKRHDFLFIGIDLPKEILRKRIKKRLEKRLEQGMIEEVENLRKSGVSWKRLEGLGLEYRFCALFLQGKITKEELREGILRDSLAYAKRQMTFLRRLERRGIRIEWVNPNTPKPELPISIE